VAALLLIDGGPPLRLPPGVDIPTAVAASLGPARQRLQMTFASREAYREFWRPHPALADDWSPVIEAYLDYDLVGEPPALRSSVGLEVLAQDSAELFDRPPGDEVLGRYAGPAGLLFVDKGLLGVEPGLYPPDEQDYWRVQLSAVTVETVPGLNHYTLVLRPDGAAQVADRLRRMA
jgi:hypothetical protein